MKIAICVLALLLALAFCSINADSHKNVLLVHGYNGSSTGVWIPWIKTELEARGYKVFNPQMPNPAHPSIEEWSAAIFPYLSKLGKGDVVVAHSLGSKAVLYSLIKSGKKISRLILVASAIGEIEEREWSRMEREWKNDDIFALRRFWETPTDLSAVSSLARVTVILSDDDPVVPLYIRHHLPKDWDFKVWHGYAHFTDEKIPAILEEILK